jgi:hypothetical protein
MIADCSLSLLAQKSSPERRMLTKVVYGVGKSDACQSLHFYYHIFYPTFLPKT